MNLSLISLVIRLILEVKSLFFNMKIYCRAMGYGDEGTSAIGESVLCFQCFFNIQVLAHKNLNLESISTKN